MIPLGGHPVFHGTWSPDMDEFAAKHEHELLEALNEAEDWFFITTAAISIDGRVAILFSKREEMSHSRNDQLRVLNDIIQEIRMQAGLQGIVIMADPKALWMAGWSHHG